MAAQPYTCLSSPRIDASFRVEIKPENFPKVVLNSQVNTACVSSGFDSSPSLTQRMERAGEGIRFRQLLSPQPSCSGTLNCLLANPVRTRQRTLVE